jgi:hypothetical protein
MISSRPSPAAAFAENRGAAALGALLPGAPGTRVAAREGGCGYSAAWRRGAAAMASAPAATALTMLW